MLPAHARPRLRSAFPLLLANIRQVAHNLNGPLIKYALHGISFQLFVSRRQLYFPNREELRAEVEQIYKEEE